MTSRIRKVYLVDDADDEIFMARIFFRRQNVGMELVAFPQLELLYDAIADTATFSVQHSLIVLDLNLTVCKGTEGIVHIRTLDIGKDILVGISTGSEDPADRLLAMDAGADFFVGKPLDRATLLAMAEQVPALTAQEDEGQILNFYRD